MLGTCGLCQRTDVDLQDSHVLPKWTYRRVRDPSSAKPDPVHVAGGRAFQSSRQEKKHFLCSPCEGLLSPSEKVVAELAVQPDDTFPFESRIGRAHGQISAGMELVETTHSMREPLAFFALSVLWRSDVMVKWIDLGPRYRETIRTYLLGIAAFPDNIYVVLSALRRAPGSFDLDKMVTSPVTHRFPHYRLHMFNVCGLEFLVAVGQTAPSWVRELCLHRAPREVALRTTSSASLSVQGFIRSAIEALKTRS